MEYLGRAFELYIVGLSLVLCVTTLVIIGLWGEEE